MLIEIDRAKFERQWVLPKLEKYLTELEKREKLDVFDKARSLAERLVIRGISPLSGLAYGRSDLARDGFLLSSATSSLPRPEFIFREMKFGSAATERLKIQLEHHRSTISVNAKDTKTARNSLQAIELMEENRIVISDSNFNAIFDEYLNSVRYALKVVRERVENDVVVEDIIFE